MKRSTSLFIQIHVAFLHQNISGSLKKILIIPAMIICLVLRGPGVLAQSEPISPDVTKQSFTYAVKDSTVLGLDVFTYDSAGLNAKKPCVLFVFGGAFVGGHRDDTIYNRYFNSLAKHGYVVVPLSYRLGMRGAKKLSPLNTAPLKKAIGMAVDDVYDATNWVIAHADSLGVDTSKIILSGSSSGAITVLSSDFARRNNKEEAQKLPVNFQYAGIMAFSGAILSYDGKLTYKTPPAPTLLFHGTADKIVPYNKIRFFNKGFYGSSWIAKTFKENSYPYYIYRAEGLGHEVAVLPMLNQLQVILDFLDRFVIQQKPYQVDMSFKDPAEKPIMTITATELFKKLQQK